MNFIQSKRLEERRKGLSNISGILENSSDSYAIHYSCESFSNLNGRTPRISSISILNLGTNDVKSFSIHIEAQVRKYNFLEMTNIEMDECELSMLILFNKFLSSNNDKKFIHWKMNSVDFGFEAINTRFRILNKNKKITQIKDQQKYDLSEILKLVYTKYFANHQDGKGKLYCLKNKNNYSSRSFLTGKEESVAFESKKWLNIQNSTQSKVKIFKEIIEDINSKSLKTETNIFKIYGVSIVSFYEIIKNNVVLTMLWWLTLLIIGAFIKIKINEVIK